MLAAGSVGADVAENALEVLTGEGDGKSLSVCTPGRVAALIAALNAAQALQATLTQKGYRPQQVARAAGVQQTRSSC